MTFDPRPLGFEEAVAALAETQDRDEIFAILLRTVAAAFEYSVVLTLYGEQAVGRMAIDRGVADMERISQVSIPLSLPSVFRTVVESKGYYFGPIYDEGINFGLLAELSRPVPASAFIMPVLIRNRVVCLLYADDGLRPVDPAWPESLVFISFQISQAFQRLILKAKRVQYSAAGQEGTESGKVDATVPLTKKKSAPADSWQVASAASEAASTRALVVDGVLKESFPSPGPPPPVQPAFPELPRKEISSPMTVPGSPGRKGDQLDGRVPPSSFDKESRAITSVGFYSLTEPPVSDDVRGEVKGAAVWGGSAAGEVISGQIGAPSKSVVEESPVKIESDTEVSVPGSPRTEDIWSLIDDLERGGPEGDLAAAALQRLGDPALKLVAFRFPGHLYQERMGQHGKLPPPSAHGPLVHFMVRMRDRGVPYLLDLLKSDNPEVRYYATYIFAELRFPSVLPQLIERAFDPAPPVRRITVEVFKQYLVEPEIRPVLEHLRAELVSPSPFRRRASAEVLGTLRDVSAVPRLMELAADRDPETSEAAQRALLLITKQAFGDSRSKWHKWWEKNQGKHRVQWLIDALSHKESECRFLASQELHQITGETLGYRFDQEKRDREEAVARWERWWESRGRPRFVSI
ncbi:MAG: hypothetical protein RBU30_00365 [Polyangia bacterium]|jgi:hypothetical protein|nr:hypothetical protein [Polyangia bacterium]